MSCPRLKPSSRSLRTLETLRPAHHGTPPFYCLRRLAHDDPSTRESREQRKPFRGQLLESIGQRLERERAEQARFAEARGDGTTSGRYFAMTFGRLFAPSIIQRTRILTRQSSSYPHYPATTLAPCAPSNPPPHPPFPSPKPKRPTTKPLPVTCKPHGSTLSPLSARKTSPPMTRTSPNTRARTIPRIATRRRSARS